MISGGGGRPNGGSHRGVRQLSLAQLGQHTHHTQPWGDPFDPKADHILRVGLQNIGGFPQLATHTKNRQILSFLTTGNFDIFAMTETNTCWHRLPVQERLHERTLGWWETLHISQAYLQDALHTQPFQAGGTCLFSINQAAHRTIESGKDTSGLGRWTWTRYRGRNQVSLRVISAYRPVPNKKGPTSVYNQQRRALYNKDDDRCPRMAFTEDLVEELISWMTNTNDQIVLLLDMNDDIRSSSVTTALQSAGLEELILHSHGPNPPPTYNRGSHPIDAIFVSPTLLAARAGYLAFGDGIPADHRCLWLDIPFSVAFGHNLPPIVTAPARRLQCRDPRIVQAYLDRYCQFILQHRLAERAFALQQQCSYPLSSEQAAEWESIDTLRVQGMQFAEARCRKLRKGQTQWSPPIQKAIDTITLYQLISKRHKGCKVSSRLIQRQAKKAAVTDARDLNHADVSRRLATAYHHLKTLKRQDVELRHTWMEDLASALAAVGKLSQATHLRNLVAREQQRRSFRHIRHMNGKLRHGSVTSVVAPSSTDGAWMEVSDKEGMEKACLDENQRRFRQANDTPFMVEPLRSAIGDLGIGAAADAVLAGNFCPPALTDPYACRLIPYLAMDPVVLNSPPVSTIIETTTHVNGWLRVKERTSSGPSGIHFGHFIAGTSHPLVSDFEATMTNIPYATGYAPLRWKKGINVELEKKKGNFRVDALRTILLFEADFNQNNKLLGRSLMANAELHSQLPPEQYGSRKSLSAIEHGLNKRLTLDIQRQKRLPGILCSNDMKSCYDRIVHPVATLCMRRLGVPEAPIVSMFSAIQNMEHHVRTAYGDSTQWFGGSEWDTPVHGVGQGNGAGPAIWAAVSTPILNLMRDEGFGVHFRSALTGELIHFVGYAFVDDTDLCQTSLSPSNYEEVLATAQEGVTLWEGIIRATGGAIVPSKTHWYLIDFKWKDGKWRYALKDESPGTLHVRDCNGILHPLERLQPFEARRTLGVRLAPDGNNRAEYQYLRQTAEDWREKIRTGHLPRHEAWLAMTTTIVRQLIYPLPATTLSPAECRQILSPVLQGALPASGIVRSFPRAMVHAPIRFQGLGVPNLYLEQGLAHIFQILRHAHVASSITGQLIRASVQQLQLELGLPGGIFTQPFKLYHNLATDCWIKHTWQFLSTNDMSIDTPGPDLPLRRRHDRFLLPSFYASGFRGAELQSLNRCRVYLQVTTLADIADGAGTSITKSAWDGHLDMLRPHYFDWPVQTLPPPRDWALWRKALIASLGVHPLHRTFSPGLGPWLDSALEWIWFYSPSEERLFARANNGWQSFSRAPGRRSRSGTSRFHVHPINLVAPLPNSPVDVLRTTVARQGNFHIMMGTVPEAPRASSTSSGSLDSFLAKLPESARWAVQHISPHDNGNLVAAAIQNHVGVAVSDGSFKNGHGTASWVLEGLNNVGRLQGNVVVPGRADDQCSYRSELTGLYSIALMVHSLCQVHGIISGSMEVGCDGLEALRRTCSPHFRPSPSDAHFDLIVATRSIMASCPITWHHRHVKGHQDNDPTALLDRWATLNIDMDYHAKLHWENTYRQARPTEMKIFGEPCSLWIQDTKVSTNLRQAVTDHIQGGAALQWLTSKAQPHPVVLDHIDWDAIHHAMKASPISRRQWVSKHTTGFCSVGKMMKRWKQWPTDACPRCGCPEDSSHVWQCQETSAIVTWEDSISSLHTWMMAQKTQPGLCNAICSQLLSWKTQIPPPSNSSNFLGLAAAITDQEAIGWQALLEGRLSMEWSGVQQRYYDWLGSRKTGRRWVVMLIRKLWQVAWDQWEHRNGFVHDQPSTTLPAQTRRAAIRQQHGRGPGTLPPTDAIHFQISLQSLLDANLHVQTAWLANVEAARQRSERRDAAGFRQERHFMQHWLRPSMVTRSAAL